MNGKGALIDADSLCYYCSKDTIAESIELLDNYILRILDFTEVDYFAMFLSEGQYFRHGIYPEYKAKRPVTQLLWTRTLKAYLKERYKAMVFKGAEADDLVAYFADKISNVVVCSIDKDVLKQVPGKNLNCGKFEYVETSADEARKYTFIQTLMGDSTDNIKGIPGVGEKGADKILRDCISIEDMQSNVFAAYLEHYKEVSTALYFMNLNFSLVYLLSRDSDYVRLFGEVPVLSNICTVKKVE